MNLLQEWSAKVWPSKVWLGVAVGLGLLSFSPPVHAYSYTLHAVYTPAGSSSTVNGVDALGDAVGYVGSTTAGPAYLWTSGGTAINLGAGIAYSITYDSTYYYVVGKAPNTSYYGAQQACLWQINRSTNAVTATNIQSITTNGTGFSCAYKVVLINGAWEAVGIYNPATYNTSTHIFTVTNPTQPYSWKSGTYTEVVNNTIGSSAFSINSSGTIVGGYDSSSPTSGPEQGFDLTSGAKLGTGTYQGDDQCVTNDINDNGYAVGQWIYQGDTSQAYVWNPTNGSVSFIGANMTASAINAETLSGTTGLYYSQVVGVMPVGSVSHAAVWNSATSTLTPSYATTPTDLNTLVQTSYTSGGTTTTFTLNTATSVSAAPSSFTLGYIGGTCTSTGSSGTLGYILSPNT